MDVGTVSSDDVIESYRRQLTAANDRIAMLESALARDRRAAQEHSKAIQPVYDHGQMGDPTE